jgi:hypothetical protein
MATLGADQVRKVYTDDGPRRWGLFAVLSCTTGDTADMSALNYYRKVNQSVFMGCTVAGTVAGTQTGATITVPAGLSGDSAYLLVDGIPT